MSRRDNVHTLSYIIRVIMQRFRFYPAFMPFGKTCLIFESPPEATWAEAYNMAALAAGFGSVYTVEVAPKDAWTNPDGSPAFDG